jgi:hypothetical protein
MHLAQPRHRTQDKAVVLVGINLNFKGRMLLFQELFNPVGLAVLRSVPQCQVRSERQPDQANPVSVHLGLVPDKTDAIFQGLIASLKTVSRYG